MRRAVSLGFVFWAVILGATEAAGDCAWTGTKLSGCAIEYAPSDMPVELSRKPITWLSNSFRPFPDAASSAFLLEDVNLVFPGCSELWLLAESECTFHVSDSWPSPGFQVGNGSLYYERLSVQGWEARRVTLTCPTEDWQQLAAESAAAAAAPAATAPALTGGNPNATAGTTPAVLYPCATAAVTDGEQLIALLTSLQRTHARVLLNLAANASLPTEPTPQRGAPTDHDSNPLVHVYRNVTLYGTRGGGGAIVTELNLRLRRNAFDLTGPTASAVQQQQQQPVSSPPARSLPVLVLVDMVLVNLPQGSPSTWPAPGFMPGWGYFVKRTGLQLHMLRCFGAYVEPPLDYIVSWRARSASLKREEAASADWLLALADLVTVLPGEDGYLVRTFPMRVPGPGPNQYTAVSQQWNTSVGLPRLTVPELLDFDLPFLPPAALAAAVPGSGGAATVLPLPSVGVAWNATGVLRLAQSGPPAGGPRVVLLMADTALAPDIWPQGGLALNYTLAITGPQAGPIVWLDTAGIALLAQLEQQQAAASLAPARPTSSSNSADGSGGAPPLLLVRLWLLGLSRQLLAASPASVAVLSQRQGDPGWGDAGIEWPAGAAEWADRCWNGGRQQAAAAGDAAAAAAAAPAAVPVPSTSVALFDSVVLLREEHLLPLLAYNFPESPAAISACSEAQRKQEQEQLVGAYATPRTANAAALAAMRSRRALLAACALGAAATRARRPVEPLPSAPPPTTSGSSRSPPQLRLSVALRSVLDAALRLQGNATLVQVGEGPDIGPVGAVGSGYGGDASRSTSNTPASRLGTHIYVASGQLGAVPLEGVRLAALAPDAAESGALDSSSSSSNISGTEGGGGGTESVSVPAGFGSSTLEDSGDATPCDVIALLDLVLQSLAATTGEEPSSSGSSAASGPPRAGVLGAVLGGVVGGVLAIGLAVGLAAAWMRQRRGRKQQGSGAEGGEKGGAGSAAQTDTSLQPRSSGVGAVSTGSGWPQGGRSTDGAGAATIAFLCDGSTPDARSILCYSSAANPMYGSDLAFSTAHEGSTMADHLAEIARVGNGGEAAAGLRTKALLGRPAEALSPVTTPTAAAAAAAARTTSSQGLTAAAAASPRGRVNVLDTQIQALVQQLQGTSDQRVSTNSQRQRQRPKLLGRGGFGSVYLGEWRGMQCAVKVLVLPPGWEGPTGGCGGGGGGGRRARLAREVALTTTLRSPHIVPTWDYTLDTIPIHGDGPTRAATDVGTREDDSDSDGTDDAAAALRLRLYMQLCEGGTLAGALEGGELSALPDVAWRRRCRRMGAPACGEQQGEGGVAGCLEQQSGGEAGAAAAAAGAEGSGGAQELQQGSAAALLVSAGAPRNGAAAAAAAHGSVAAALVSTSDQDEVPSQRQACAGAREAQGNSQQGAQPGRYGGSHMGTGPEAGPEAGRSGSAAGPQGLLAATCSTENDTGLGEQALSWDELGPSPNLPLALLAALDIARGLAYLHKGSAGKAVTVHGDLNDNNVLLKAALPQLPQPLPQQQPPRISCSSARAAATAAATAGGQQRSSLETRRATAGGGGAGGGASGSQRGQARCLDLMMKHAVERPGASPHRPASIPPAASRAAMARPAEADVAMFSRPSSQPLSPRAGEPPADAAAGARPDPSRVRAQTGPCHGGLWVAGLTATGGGAAPVTACSTHSGGGHTPTRSLHLLATTMTLTSLTGTQTGTGTGGWEAAQQQAANAVAAQSILSYVYKIADFGLSIQINGASQTHVSNMQQGTPCFAAPEVVAQGRLSPAADVYSYGVLLWLLLHGVPMRRVRHLLPRSAFLPAGPLLLQHASQGLPPSALSLLAACLAAEPAARPGAVELAARVEELLKVAAGPELSHLLINARRRELA